MRWRTRSKPTSGSLSHARLGVGKLLQRDYWAVIDRCRLSPTQVARFVAERFTELPPPEIVRFHRGQPTEELLREGEELEVDISGAGTCRVRCIHRDAQSLTLSTVAGHPEAGRITFGAYPDDRGHVIFHIRSRARSGTHKDYAGFMAIGEALQTTCWTEFVNAVCLNVGEGVAGFLHVVTTSLPEDEPDEVTRCMPTYLARGAE